MIADLATWQEWQESEGKIKDYITMDLKMDVPEITIERAHRMTSRQKPCPIIAKFAFFKGKRKESDQKREHIIKMKMQMGHTKVNMMRKMVKVKHLERTLQYVKIFRVEY